MYYYTVAVGSSKYHGRAPLTYHATNKLAPGTLVQVPLQRQQTIGFILARVDKPSFSTKAISDTYSTIPPIQSASRTLVDWLISYYPAPLAAIASLVLPPSLPTRSNGGDVTAAKQEQQPTLPLPPLRPTQADALAAMEPAGTHILHGDTGSGKTRLYLELAMKAIANNRSIIVLTPEISLTTQLVQVFQAHITDVPVVVIHSHLTAKQRRIIWLELAARTEPVIVIGARSALFAPISSIGLIVVDEFHEFTYKQESAPYYHTVRVASKLGQIHDALVILGSATPPVNEYKLALERKRPIIPIRWSHDKDVKITTIDMRTSEKSRAHSAFSAPLLAAITETIRRKEQVLLFINRRGTAKVVLCASCGWQATCPHCDLALTYHQDSFTFQCHVCNYREPARTHCPECASTEIILKSLGTKAAVDALKKAFPAARIERFDADNRKGERLHELYDAINDGSVNILVGTQLLAKGLDLPHLGLVGIVNADASLAIPDYTATERTYQLITQLIGRLGRSSQATKQSVIIQTYSPDNMALRAATHKQWPAFLETELEERQRYVFPPYCHLLKITCKRASSSSAQTTATAVADTLRQSGLRIIIEGPAPAFHAKIQNKYVWQLIIKSKDRSELLKVIELLPRDWSYDIDPVHLL